MNDRQFIAMMFAVAFAALSVVIAINYVIDPYWHYGHHHQWNQVQTVIDEREQKAVALRDYATLDTVLLGSSRATYIPSNAFDQWDVFNFAAANYSMREYHTFVLYTLEQHPETERFIIGIDFFKSNTTEASTPRSLTNYVEKIEQPLYKTRYLLSLPSAKYALRNAWLSSGRIPEGEKFYTRDGDVLIKKEAMTEEQFQKKVETFANSFYRSGFTYFDQYEEIMSKVRETIGSRESIWFTTPISTPLFETLIDAGLYEEYEKWLKGLVETNGSIWHFMYPNEITDQRHYYMDGHHFYPEIGMQIAKRLEYGYDAEDVSTDFGIYVTKDNVEEVLVYLRMRLKERGLL